jgi:nucleoid-associated protein YgaU
MIYQDASIIIFRDGTEGLFSHMPKPDRGRLSQAYVVKDEDTLFSIANEAYGDTRMWYDISEFNFENLDNPFDLVPGTILYLPIP